MTDRPYEVGAWGAFFATRDSGRKLRIDVDACAARVLDFTGVEAISVAFADELICGLVVSGQPISVIGVNADVRETIVRATKRRGVEIRVWFGPDAPTEGAPIDDHVERSDVTADELGRIVEACSLPGHDRDLASAMLSQSRLRAHALDEVQVAHLLAIGHARGVVTGRKQAEARGYARAVAALRDDERYQHWWTGDGAQRKPTGRYWSYQNRQHLADYLETIEKPLPGHPA